MAIARKRSIKEIEKARQAREAEKKRAEEQEKLKPVNGTAQTVKKSTMGTTTTKKPTLGNSKSNPVVSPDSNTRYYSDYMRTRNGQTSVQTGDTVSILNRWARLGEAETPAVKAQQRQQAFVDDYLANKQAVDKLDDDNLSWRERYNLAHGMGEGARNLADAAGEWEKEYAYSGDEPLEEYFGSAEQLLSGQAQQLAEIGKSLYSPEYRRQLQIREDAAAQEVRDASALLNGNGARELTADETIESLASIDEQIALYEKLLAEEPDNTVYRAILKSYRTARDEVASRDAVNYDGDYEAFEAAPSRYAEAVAEYGVARAEVDQAAQEARRISQQESDRRALESVRRSMQRAGVSPEAYSAEWATRMLETERRPLKQLFDRNARSYTLEDYAMIRYAQEHMPESADRVEELLEIQADARRNEAMARAVTSENRPAVLDNAAMDAALGVTGRLASTINGIDILLQRLEQKYGDRTRVNYERTAGVAEAGEAATQSSVEDLAELGSLEDLIPGLRGTWVGGLNLGKVYQAGVDSLASAANAAMFGRLTGAVTGLQVGSSAFHDAKDRGATDDTAGKNYLAEAFNEGLGEQVSFDVFTDLGKRAGLFNTRKGKLALGILQTANEGLQEGATEKLNLIADRAIMGVLSNHDVAVREAMAAGYVPDEAEAMVREQEADQVADAILGGAIGGAMRAGTTYAGQSVNDLLERETAYRDIGASILENDNAAQMAALIGEVTGKETAAAKRAGQAGRQYGKFVKKADSYVAKADDATRNIVERKVERVKAAPFEALQGTSEAARQKAEERLSGMQKSDEGASYGGENVKVNGITKVGDKAEVTVTKADGSAVQAPASEVTFSSADAEIYAYAADMATPELANRFRMTVKPEQLRNIDRVANAYSQAYDMAKAGFREESVAASYLVKDVLTGEQVSEVYKLGADTRKSEQVKAVTVAAERAKASMGNAWKGGEASFDDSVDVGSLTEAQKTQVDMASVITGSMGINVVFFESQANAKGRYTAENGRYDRRTNTIYLDVNAGRNSRSDSMSQTALLRTLSHEITHAIQRNSPEIYGEIRDMVVEVLGGAQGITIEDLIDAKMARDSSLKTRDAALNEVVADACETMLRDSDAMRLLQEAHPEAAKTFGETLRELAGRIIEAIKAAFKGRKLSTEAQLLMQDAERYREIADKWARGVVETAEVSGRENGSAADEATETEDMADEKAAISEDTAAEGEDITSEVLVGAFDEPARAAETHIDNRTWEAMGERGVRAFMNEYKYARNYMGPAAKALLQDANASLPGERYRTADGEWGGQKRQTTDVLAELKDRGGWTWEQLKDALNVIADIYDDGDLETEIPNTAIIRRTELMLDEMLTQGYSAMDGVEIVPDAGYQEYKAQLPGAATYETAEQQDGVTFEEYTQFEMRNPVEQAHNLVAIHNITEEKLRSAIQLGGFPMPSIAIAKRDIGHQNFGPISLVFGRATIDPKLNRKNKVYSADAWTPTFPRIEYEVDSDVDARVYEKLSSLKSKVDDLYAQDLSRVMYGIGDQLNSHGGEEGFIKYVLDNYGLKAAYLEDRGGHARAIKKSEKVQTGYSPQQAERYEAIVNLIGIEELRHKPVNELLVKYGDEIDAVWPGAANSSMRFSRLLMNAVNYYEKKGTAPEYKVVTDMAASHAVLDDSIDMEAYEVWVRDLFKGIESASGVYNGKDLYTSTGNRRSFKSTHYPVTVENIAKAMYDAHGGKMKNVSAHFDAKTMRAVTARTFRSVDEMHKYEGRMMMRTQEEADALTEDLNSRLNGLISRLQADRNAGRKLDLYDQMTQLDQIGAIIQEIATKKFDAASLKNGLAGYGYQISDQMARELSTVIQEISEMPVNIFEAKPERAVYFDEVKYAIVPDNMNSEVRSQLEQLVPDVREYTEGDEERRLELLNEREDVMFSIRETTDGRKVVAIEKDILKGIYSDGRWSEQQLKEAKKAVIRAIANGVYADARGIPVHINSKGKKHIAGSSYAGTLIKKQPEKFADYMRGASLANEYVVAAVDWTRDSALRHERKDDYTGFERGLVYIDVRGRQFEAEAVVGITKSGRRELYDIVRMNSTNFEYKKEAEPPATFVSEDADSSALGHTSLPDSIARFINERNSDSQNQTREEAITTRFVLSQMIEGATTNSNEKAFLRGYQKDLKRLEQLYDAIEQNKQITRELMFKKGRTPEETERLNKARERTKILQEQVARLDEGLLNLEQADVIRGLVEREAQKIRAKEAEKRRESVAKYRESQRNAAIRKNIRRRAMRIDRMLRMPSDKDHIPEGLREAILEMMETITSVEDAFGGAQKDRERLYRAQREYEAMHRNEEDGDLSSRFDEDTAARLAELGDLMKDKRLKDFDQTDLTKLSLVIEHFEYLIRDQNEAFAESRRRKTEAYAERVWEQTSTAKGRKENAITASALVKALKHLGHANVIPPYFYKHLGGAMGDLGADLLRAEGRYGVNMKKADRRLEEIRRKYEHDKWATKRNDILKLTTEEGKTLELNREQALGIWASAKRERLNRIQRAAHLRDGGVMLEKTARKLGMKGVEIDVTPTRLSEGDIAQIDRWLTDQQKRYADEMVGYISRDMAALGNETSMELAGYRKFGEGYYYPYKTSNDFLRTEPGSIERALIRNMGFTKSVVRNAKTPVVITDFSRTVADHVNSMLMYNAFAVAQDQLMRVYDFKLDSSNSVKNLLRKAYGDEVPAYIEQHMRDLYGGVSPDRDAGLANWLIGAHKKQAVLGSLSVAIQQPTAIMRAMAIINPRYFAGRKVKGGFVDAQNYAGTAVIKDIGGFDSGVSAGAVEWLNGNPKDWRNHAVTSALDTVSDWAGKLAEWGDQGTWSLIWKAVCREQAAKYKMDPNDTELKEIAGERFDEVVRLTQVYDSVMTRSQLMRNKNVFWKMATSFMSEPTVTWNMVLDAAVDIVKNRKWGKAAGTVAAVLASTVLTNLAKAIVMAARDDDDEKATYLERYAKNATEGLINDMIPFNYMPIVRDIYSALQGYDVERADMTLVTDVIAIGKTLTNENKSPLDKVEALVQALGYGLHIPLKNIWRDVEAAINTATSTPQREAREGWLRNALRTGAVEATPIGKWLELYDSKSRSTDQLFEALMNGDLAGAKEIRKHLIEYNGAKDDEAVDSLLRTRIKEGYLGDEIDAEEALDMLIEHTGYSPREAAEQLDKWRYDVETGSEYSKLKDDFISGELSAAEVLDARTEYGGANEVEARRTINHWQYEKDTGRVFSDMKADYLNGKITRKQAVEYRMKYGGAFESEAEAEVLTWDYEKDTGRSWDDMKYDYMSKEISAKQAIQYRVKYGGKDEYDAEGDVLKWDFEIDYGYPYDDMKEYFKLGKIGKEKAIAARVKYGRSEEDDAYFAVTGWEYEKATGKEWQGKFTKLHEGIEADNESAMRSAITEIYEKSAYEDESKAASAVTSNITSTYKPLYIAASEAERAEMEPILLDAYRLAYELAGKKYYGDSHRLNLIRKWLEDEEEE